MPTIKRCNRISPFFFRTLHASARNDVLASLKPSEPLERPRCRHSRDLPQRNNLHVQEFLQRY